MNEQLVPRHVAWRHWYHGRRYARYLSPLELNQRIRDIVQNLVNLTPDAKLGLQTTWLEKWTHVLEEMQWRHGPYPAGFSRDIFASEPFPNFASELAGKAARKLSSFGLKRGNVFIKFGKRKFMEQLYEEGMLRIQPASFFASMDHNGAIRDDELSRSISLVLSREDIIRLVINPQDVPLDVRHRRLDVQFQFPSDYWLYCLTVSVEPRLFVDFDADACVIIRDRARFGQMLRDVSSQQIGGATMHEGPAEYVDPLLPRTARISVPFVKHFRYTYQDEHRFCWLPSAPIQRVDHVDIRLGSLAECADLIVL